MKAVHIYANDSDRTSFSAIVINVDQLEGSDCASKISALQNCQDVQKRIHVAVMFRGITDPVLSACFAIYASSILYAGLIGIQIQNDERETSFVIIKSIFEAFPVGSIVRTDFSNNIAHRDIPPVLHSCQTGAA